MLRAIVIAAGLTSAAFIAWLGQDLPPHVASHFGPDGRADGFMPRALFVGFGSGVTSVLPVVVCRAQRKAARRNMANIPNAAFWFAAPRRAGTQSFLDRHAAVFCVAMTLFLCVIWALVASVNRTATAAQPLDMTRFWLTLAVFVAFTIGWVIELRRRFNKGLR